MNNNIAFTLLASLIIGIFGATMAAVQYAIPATPVFAAAADTCPATDGWFKKDGLTGLTYTYTPPSGFTVTDNCMKVGSHDPLFGTGTTVTNSTLFNKAGCTAPGEPERGCNLQDISHASFKLARLEGQTNYCDPSQKPSGSIGQWLINNQIKGSDCFAYVPSDVCGMFDAKFTMNLTPYEYEFRYVLGNTTPEIANYEGNGALPVNFTEDQNGGSVTLTYYTVGPEKDYFVGFGIPNIWDRNGATVVVDTDCEDNQEGGTPTPTTGSSATPTPTGSNNNPTATPTPGPVGGTTTQSVLGTTDTQPSKSVLGASTLAGTGTFDRTMANVFAMTAILFFILSGAAYAKKNR